MSFTQDIKREICLLEHSDCCVPFLLLGIIKGSSSMSFENGKWILNIKTTQNFVARFIIKLLKRLELDKNINYEESNQFQQNLNKIIIKIPDIVKVGEKIGYFEGLKFDSPNIKDMGQCCRRSYFAGMFLVSGSVNTPKTTNYHFEIVAFNKDTLNFVGELLQTFGIESKIFTRKSTYHTLYVKRSAWISDILKILGAVNSVHYFEDARIQRDMMVSIQRLNNTEIANRKKTISSSKKQIKEIDDAIEYLGIGSFNEFERLYIKLRKENEDCSINELCELMEDELKEEISKSRLNHIILKIRKIANEKNNA